MRRAENGVTAAQVVQLEEDVPHRVDPPRPLPDLAGMQRREQQLLATYRVDLLSDDCHDLRPNAVPERQQRVDARHQLADVATTHEQAVTHGLGIGRVFSECGDERL